MPRTTIHEDNKLGADTERFPTIKLGKDERARIACLDVMKVPVLGPDGVTQVMATRLAPMQEWVHRLQAPKIVDGKAQRTKHTGRDGAEYIDWDYEFIGMPICLGAEAILREQGRDVTNCPVCVASVDNPHIEPPKPTFAMNIVRYATRPGSFELAAPFSAQVIAWRFPASRFDKLCDLARDDAPNGDLTQVDVKLGPCTDTGYQKYDIGVVANQPATWTLSAELKQYIRTLWTAPGNRATDEQLTALCGRTVTNRAFLDEDLRRVNRQWAIAEGQQAVPQPFAGAQPFQAAGMQAMAADAAAMYGQQAVPQVPSAPAAPAVPQPGQALAAAAAPDMAALAAQQQAALANAGVPQNLIPGAAQLVPGAQAAPAIPGHPGGIEEFAPQAQAAPAGYIPGPALPGVPQPAAQQPGPAVPQVAQAPQVPLAAPAVAQAPGVPMVAPAPQVPAAAPALPAQPAGTAVAFDDLTSF